MIRFFSTVTAIALLGNIVTAVSVQNCRPGVDAGIIACPCANPPAGGGLGCDKFGAGPAASGTLTSAGAESVTLDGVTLIASGENNAALTVFFTGAGALSATGVPHGAGVRCVTVSLKRLYSGNAALGAITRPGAGDPSVTAKSAAVGAPIVLGNTRHYFCVYRDPGAAVPCANTASVINDTNSLSITWGP